VVADGDVRGVADAQTAGVQPPDQVDVLADPQPGVERADVAHHGRPGDEGGGRHVGQPGAGCDARGPLAEVETGGGTRVAPGRAVRRQGTHPRRDRGDERVGEVRHEPLGPVRGRHAVTVHKGHQCGGDVVQSGVPREAGATVDVAADELRAVLRGNGGDGGGVFGSVVDNEDGVPSVEPGEAAAEQLGPVADGDRDREIRGRAGFGRHGVGEPGVGEPPGEHTRGGGGDRAVGELPPGSSAGRGQPEHAGRGAPEDQLIAQAAGVGVEFDPEPRG
jgi:hypothetical protein